MSDKKSDTPKVKDLEAPIFLILRVSKSLLCFHIY